MRREELVVHRSALPDDPPEQPPAQATSGQPLVIVLREQVPVVQLAVRPYERVTAVVEQVNAQQSLSVELRKEHVQIDTGRGAGRPPRGQSS